jgi:hypothetical protein
MFPKYEQLVKAKGKHFTFKPPKDMPKGEERKVLVRATVSLWSGLVLDPENDGSDKGIFIFYESGKAHYGYADAGINWACSGPYSGCKFQIGKDEAGRIYASHISVEGGKDYSDQLKLKNTTVFLNHKTGMDDVDYAKAQKLKATQAVKYLFAWWAGADLSNISLTEVTIMGTSMDQGKIVMVTKAK